MQKKDHPVPVDPPCIFSNPKSFVHQNLDVPPRKPGRKNINYEYRLKATQQRDIHNDTI